MSKQDIAALIDAWVAAHGKPIPWDSAVTIAAVLRGLESFQEHRLRHLAEEASDE